MGCCSLRVEHLKLHEKYDDQEFVVEFDFLGKDSIRYYNRIPVEKRVFKNLQLFMENKQPGDDLFDRLNVSLKELGFFCPRRYAWGHQVLPMSVPHRFPLNSLSSLPANLLKFILKVRDY